MFFSKILGLITTLAVPNSLHMLMFTKMSSTPYTAYRRYLSTIFHMCIWYDKEFKPGSELWRSLDIVKGKHNSASKRSCTSGFTRINQMDMVLTQFGFIGFVLTRAEKIGIHKATTEELEGFVHFWRVIGYMLGIEDRFNMCGGSVDETRKICDLLIQTVFQPTIKKQDPRWLMMSDVFLSGMWVMQPLLNTTVFLNYCYFLLNTNIEDETKTIQQIPMSIPRKIQYAFISFYIYCLQFYLLRVFSQYVQYMSFWLMRNFPFLVFYQFGFRKVYVPAVLNETDDKVTDKDYMLG